MGAMKQQLIGMVDEAYKKLEPKINPPYAIMTLAHIKEACGYEYTMEDKERGIALYDLDDPYRVNKEYLWDTIQETIINHEEGS